MTRTQVLVVGAGPSGLGVACELLRRGVEVTVVDADPEPGRGSRAILLWPPGLDVLDDAGVLDTARSRGRHAEAMAYHMGDGSRLRVELAEADRPLLLPQEQTGALLLDAVERLGGTVRRSLRLTGLDQQPGCVRATLTEPSGASHVVEADWLIGADGIGSTVRGRLGVEFPGQDVPTTFLLAEGELTGAIERTEMNYYLGPAGSLLIAPLPDDVVRVSGPLPPGTEASEDVANRLLRERGPGGLSLRVTTGAWAFESQERIAAALRVGRCFLVGDAAHVHSVVGGQGLNLGLQDGRNLGWKLAGVVRGTLAPAILDSYDPERRAAAEQVVAATRRMAAQAVAGPVASRVRNAAWTVLSRTGMLRRFYGPMLAGRALRYPPVLGLPASSRLRRPVARVGARPPRWVPPGSDFRLVTTGELSFSGAVPSLTHEHLSGPGTCFVLVRPDGVVAAAGRTREELDAAVAFLRGLVIEERVA